MARAVLTFAMSAALTLAFVLAAAARPADPPEAPEGFGTRRVYLDAGHGTGHNQGAQTAGCGRESELVLGLAEGLRAALEETGHFEVTLSRTSSAGPSYRDRLAEATRLGAHVLLSVHADVRGAPVRYRDPAGRWCLRNPEQAGFSILYSDRGGARRVAARAGLARSLARHLARAGFEAYDGVDYAGLYVAGATAGVFVDRRGLFMLRRPRMPSVIIETMHALHPAELRRWGRAETQAAFHEAVIRALYANLSATP